MGAPTDSADGASLEATRGSVPATMLVIGAIFLALACLDLYRAIAPLATGASWAQAAGDSAMVGLVGIAALVGGVFLLLGRNWARWLLAAWMMLHVAISVTEPTKLVGHVVIFGVIAYLLFRPATAAYFRRGAGPGDPTWH